MFPLLSVISLQMYPLSCLSYSPAPCAQTKAVFSVQQWWALSGYRFLVVLLVSQILKQRMWNFWKWKCILCRKLGTLFTWDAIFPSAVFLHITIERLFSFTAHGLRQCLGIKCSNSIRELEISEDKKQESVRQLSLQCESYLLNEVQRHHLKRK